MPRPGRCSGLQPCLLARLTGSIPAECVSIWCLSPSGKASGCDSDMRGFDPHQTPQGDVAQLVRAQDS